MEQLRAADLDFYGSDSSGWSDSSADDDEFPPAKRTRAASQLPPLALAALALPRKMRARVTTQYRSQQCKWLRRCRPRLHLS